MTDLPKNALSPTRTGAMVMDGSWDYIPKDFFDKFDNIQAWLKKYNADPRIQEFYKEFKN